MPVLRTIGALIEIQPWDDLQYWPSADTEWDFVEDRTPFRFRVAGELIDSGVFFGVYGPVIYGPERYSGLICSAMLRSDNADWFVTSNCSANFRVGPTIVRRVDDYDSAEHNDLRFYSHPDGTYIDGYPRISRYGEISAIDELWTELTG